MLRLARFLTILLPPSLLLGPVAAEILIALIALMFLVHAARGHDWRWAKSPWMAALLLLWLHFILGSVLSADPADNIHRSLLWIRYPLLLAALSTWILDATTQRRTLWTVLGTVLFLGYDMLLQYYNGYDVFGHVRFDLIGFSRLTGPFSGPRAGITLVWIAFPAFCFLLALAQEQTRSLRKQVLQIAALLMASLVIWAVYLSGERMAFLLLALGLILALLLLRGARMLMLAIILLALGTMTFITSDNSSVTERQFYQTRDTITHFSDSPYGRMMRSALGVWRDHALLGAGMKGFRTHCPEAKHGPTTPEALARRCGLHPHNPYLELLTESGIIGLMLHIFAMSAIAMQVWYHRRAITTDAIVAGLVITFALRLWPLVAVTSQFIPWSAAPFWLFTGFLLARVSHARH